MTLHNQAHVDGRGYIHDHEPQHHIVASPHQFPPGTVVHYRPMKEVSTAYLLWAFFAFLGIHRFYLGHTGMGALMLVLTLTVVGWPVSVIIAIVDAFMIPRWVRAANGGVV